MKLNLSRDLAEKVLSLTRDYSYAPEEVISIGIALTTVLLKERGLGNQVVIVDPNGDDRTFSHARPGTGNRYHVAIISSILTLLP